MREQARLQEVVDQRLVVPVPPDDELGGGAEGLDDERAVGRGDDLVGLWKVFFFFFEKKKVERRRSSSSPSSSIEPINQTHQQHAVDPAQLGQRELWSLTHGRLLLQPIGGGSRRRRRGEAQQVEKAGHRSVVSVF